MDVKLKDLYLPVEKVDMGVLLPDLKHLSGMSYATIVTSPTGERIPVNYCSEDYHLVRNEDILPKFLQEVGRFYDTEVHAKTKFWTRFYVDVIIKNKGLVMSSKDPVFARVRYVNSYDGKVKYHYAMSFWRKICGNGMMGFVNWDSVTRMHTPGLGDETNFAKVLEMVSKFLAEAENHFDRYRELNYQTVRDPLNRIQEIASETSFPSSLVEDVVERLETERTQLDTAVVTDWLIYNAFNYQLNHNEEYKAKEEKKAKVDSEVFQYLLNY